MQAPAETRAEIEADTFDEQDRRQVGVAKLNLDIEQTKWPNHSFVPAERVSKQVRMRVRYTCHNCNTSFGYEKECTSCRHRRCARCDRYPPRKPRPAVESNIPTPAPVAPAETNAPEKSEAVMDLICTCHECQTVIELEVEECPNCHHTICDRCHREARLQSIDAQETDISSKQEEGDRKAPPEEQKLPPDSSTTEDQQQEESR